MSSSSPLPGGEVVVYQAPDGEVRVDVRLERETVWLTQQQMADLFGRERSVVTRSIELALAAARYSSTSDNPAERATRSRPAWDF